MPKTRAKNRLKHPAAPIMTRAQLTAAGIPTPPLNKPQKKQTKDQRIAALEEDLRITRELLQTNHPATAGGSILQPSDNGGDTEPATDDHDNYMQAGSQKRKSQRSATGGVKLKRARAMDVFEMENLHSGTTGLVDDWRLRLTPVSSAVSHQLPTPRTHATPELQWSPDSNTPLTTPTLAPTPTPMPMLVPMLASTPTPILASLCVEDTHPVLPVPRTVAGQRIYPGIKDLPDHIRTDFRNIFIRPIIQNIFNSEKPWVNPDLSTLQSIYNSIYPAYPVRLRPNDAVFHPTVTSLAVVRSRIGAAAVTAVHRHLTNMFRKKRLLTLDSRAKFVSEKFKSDDEHPFLWNHYVVGDIPNHHETRGYQTIRRGVFQSEPILETLLVYYSSYGIMEIPPTEDPGEGSRPIGALAIVTAAVERAYRMYLSGDYVEATQSFNTEFWGSRTKLFLDYIKVDLVERHWDGIFRGLAAISAKAVVEAAVENGMSQAPKKCVPLPPSDPPSPPAQD